MKATLTDVATIQIGYQFRSRFEADPNGVHQVIQIKSFDDDGQLDVDNLETVTLESKADNYLVHKGDVLFLSRGHRNFAYALPELEHDTIAVSHFFIVRVNQESVMPEYLAWYLNQKPAQSTIESVARQGTRIPMVTRSAFGLLEIDIPPMAIQKNIVELEHLQQKERDLTSQILNKRSELVEAVTLKAIKLETGS